MKWHTLALTTGISDQWICIVYIWKQLPVHLYVAPRIQSKLPLQWLYCFIVCTFEVNVTGGVFHRFFSYIASFFFFTRLYGEISISDPPILVAHGIASFPALTSLVTTMAICTCVMLPVLLQTFIYGLKFCRNITSGSWVTGYMP